MIRIYFTYTLLEDLELEDGSMNVWWGQEKLCVEFLVVSRAVSVLLC